MNGKTFFFMTLMLFFVSISSVALEVKKVEASGTIYIRADGSIGPPTAPISTTDNVTYTFTENINDSIVVERDSIVIDGSGYTLRGTGSIAEKGLDLSSRTNVTIKNIQVTKSYYGIFLSNSTNNTVVKNNMTSNVYGVTLADYSTNNSINENIFANDGLWIIPSYKNTVKDNLVNGKPLTYLEDMSNVTVNSNTGQVVLVECNDMTVENLDLSNTSCSIQLVSTNNSKVANNNIMNSRSGIGLWSSSNNCIYRNNITANSIGGIGLGRSSTNNTISENIVVESPIGMEFVGSTNNTISGNNITASIYSAIEIGQSSNTVISQNNVANSTYGIVLSGSSNSTLRENNIVNNDNGLLLYNSSNNKIHHNYFHDNANQTSIQSSSNMWDDGFPSGGNYWSNYNGTDANYDGVGNTEYSIDVNNIDHFPLMGMFSEFDWISLAAPEQRVQTICNSTISNLIYNGTAISFNVTGEDGTAGFCRICIPTVLLNITYKVFVNGTEVTCRLLPFSNETYSYLYFNYTHSTREVIIIPEFPSFFIFPLLTTATLLAAIVCRKLSSNRLSGIERHSLDPYLEGKIARALFFMPCISPEIARACLVSIFAES
jgi:parallel beta-helix repeat protein